MRNLDDIDVKEVIDYLKKLYNKTTKKQRLWFCLVIFLLSSGYMIGKNLWERYTIFKQAKNIITKISKSENSVFEKDGTYKKDIFSDPTLASSLSMPVGFSYDTDFNRNSDLYQRRPSSRYDDADDNLGTGISGKFYIEVDADNACVVLKYERNTPDRTTYYASFKDDKILCKGKKCFKEANNKKENLCYTNGSCFHANLNKNTKRSCGNGRGSQTRECTPSCDGGNCGEWGECTCDKGFEWDGKTCKQTQTEQDCTEEQCFNGIYCEDKESITKNIENGNCKRSASCQKNKGWIYTPWECSCNDYNFCSSKEECLPRPKNKAKITLPDEQGFCNDVYYSCQEGQGWIEKAKRCTCNKAGYFWDSQTAITNCSPCTQKPNGAVFTSAGKNKDNCEWKCDEGYQKRNGTCVKPNGQYLCAPMNLQICTDDFSKSRKIKKDARKTNEQQLCFVEDKDNVLFYNQKEKSCILCQCLDLITGKATN